MARRSQHTWMPVLLALAAGPALQVAAPTLGGVRLGGTAQEVQKVLGAPDRTQESIGLRFWDYERRGIALIWREGESGVHGIVVSNATAGDIRGVRVGDSEAVLRREWGEPARIRQGGRFLDYVGDRWVFSIELRERAVVEMTLMGTRDAR